VDRFLRRDISFLDIAQLVERVLQLDWQVPVEEIEAILQVDREARIKFEEVLKR
jgi:1-deoxy-D-xylulose 5-phosphate reductoisomerase